MRISDWSSDVCSSDLPVDHDQRSRLLDELVDAGPADALAHLDDGGAKLWTIATILRHRRRDPAPFRSSTYRPIAATGEKARHAVAFERDGLVVVVPRLLVGLGDDWDDTSIEVPAGGGWIDLLSAAKVEPGPTALADLLDAFPVVVLAREDDSR